MCKTSTFITNSVKQLLVACVFCVAQASVQAALPTKNLSPQLKVVSGYSINIYARDLPNARMLLMLDDGYLLVSSPKNQQVLLLMPDRNGDGSSDGQQVLLDKLNSPHGLAILNGWLYIAEVDAVARIRFDVATKKISGEVERIITNLPVGGHWTRTIKVGPDKKLYLSLGSSCNVCIETDKHRASMMRFNPDGSLLEIIATGLRNSVGFDWSPTDHQLYATENSRDLLGDDFPPDELNRITVGGFYGWPYLNGNNVSDPDMGKKLPTHLKPIVPVHAFRAHNAPLGIQFLKHQQSVYQHSALVALHGSWNRSTKDGYKVVSLHWDKQRIYECPFISGFEHQDKVIGRPVGVEEDKAGRIYISDDFAGVVYRVVKTGAVANIKFDAMCR